MGFQKKSGKGRIDKWYRLAKEKGYRARAAFKLIQLNRRYGFLEKSRVVLDLCAAPGSWCQVAAETMPAKSILIGVDLVPMKPIPRAITLQSDITTDQCRSAIRHHLKTWKVDTVLHDGAPNVGSAWVQDAFSQAGLVLQALKLACDLLSEGGIFVTKVFRSKDYNALLWIFNQLFTKVSATKPPASRSVSAEIFVVCQGFKAPKRLDPKLLDPRFAFAELLKPSTNDEEKVFNPEKKKRKREGYEEGDYIQFKDRLASEFVQSSDPIAILGSASRLSFQPAENDQTALAAITRLPETTPEVLECCSDLKVLGRKEFRLLLRWRMRAREVLGLSINRKVSGQSAAVNEIAEIVPMDDELHLQEELQLLDERESKRKKRERRRNNEKRQKEIRRLQLRMTNSSDIGLDQEGLGQSSNVLHLQGLQSQPESHHMIGSETSDHSDSAVESQLESPFDEDERYEYLEDELDELYSQFQERKALSSERSRAKKARSNQNDDGFEGLSDDNDHTLRSTIQGSPGETSSSDEIHRSFSSSPLLPSESLTKSASLFFEQDIFHDLGFRGSEASSGDLVQWSMEDEGKTNSVAKNDPDDLRGLHAKPREDGGRANQQCARETPKTTLRSASTQATDESNVGFEVVPQAPQDEGLSIGQSANIQMITAEALTLAQQLASGQKSIRTVVDDGFNKYSFRDVDGVPDWFLDDEKKHSSPQQPITAEGASAIKQKLRALNARPIKKVREAKDRKKFKAAQRLEKLRKKSAILVEDETISEKDKASNVSRLMARTAKRKPKQQVQLVVAKGGNKGISGRPRGVKGKYKIVDARLKKDIKARKRSGDRKH